jgi:hypothetical protein
MKSGRCKASRGLSAAEPLTVARNEIIGGAIGVGKRTPTVLFRRQKSDGVRIAAAMPMPELPPVAAIEESEAYRVGERYGGYLHGISLSEGLDSRPCPILALDLGHMDTAPRETWISVMSGTQSGKITLGFNGP